MIEIKKEFSDRELLWFGPLFALFVGLIGLILMRRLHWDNVAYGLWTVSAVIIVVYYLVPSIRKPTYLAWIYSVVPIGWVVSHVLLGTVFYLVVTPVGLAMKALKYDPMQRTLDPAAKSYWIKRESQVDISSYFRQY